MNPHPLISVIIPAYNVEKYLSEAVESALAQTYRPVEVIVVNDGSTDNTQQVIESFGDRITAYSQTHQGVSVARNMAISRSAGDFIAFLDADDVWLKNKLELQMAVFAEHPDLDVVFGHVEHFISPELDGEIKSRIKCPKGSQATHLPSLMLVKKSSFLRVGYFDENLLRAEGVDWYARALDAGFKLENVPQVICRRRLFKSAASIDKSLSSLYAVAIKKALDRRRHAVKRQETET